MKLLMIRTFACLLLTLCFCTTSHAQPRIIGGTDVPEGSYPWMASIGSPSGGSTNIRAFQFCGGMLVSPDYVLTAAHCVDRGVASGIEVVVGVTNLGNVPSTAQRRGVTEIIIHPDYRSEGFLSADVALLRLDSPITNITPIPIATSPTPAAGTVVKAIGWGFADRDRQLLLDPLQQITTQTVSLSQLQSDWGNSITLEHLGAFADDKNGCNGDSGGPLFTESPLSLLGITSFGDFCMGINADAYANVGFFSAYINSIILVESIPGDVNRDGIINFLDIASFISAMTNGVYQVEADIDQNGVVDFLDLAPFIAILVNQSTEL